MRIRNFNLIVTTSRGHEEDVCSEVWYLLRTIGNSEVKVDRTGISGLIVAKTAFNPFEVIEKFRAILRDKPYEFRYTLRVVPVERVVLTSICEIQLAVTELITKIKEDETFRVTVERRFTNTPTSDIITAAVANVKRRVNLEYPDKIILIEVLGRLTGISVINPQDILSITKEKCSFNVQ